LLQIVDKISDFITHVGGHRIKIFRVVEGQSNNVVLAINQNVFVRGHAYPSFGIVALKAGCRKSIRPVDGRKAQRRRVTWTKKRGVRSHALRGQKDCSHRLSHWVIALLNH
jgi:hypothetical protein